MKSFVAASNPAGFGLSAGVDPVGAGAGVAAAVGLTVGTSKGFRSTSVAPPHGFHFDDEADAAESGVVGDVDVVGDADVDAVDASGGVDDDDGDVAFGATDADSLAVELFEEEEEEEDDAPEEAFEGTAAPDAGEGEEDVVVDDAAAAGDEDFASVAAGDVTLSSAQALEIGSVNERTTSAN